VGAVKSVPCRARGGGKEGPLFAAIGCQVTVADVSREQPKRSRDTAVLHRLEAGTIEADKLDPS
jgi:hypothetical protein